MTASEPGAGPPVLLLAPTEQDARYSSRILCEAGVSHRVFRRVDALLEAIDADTGAVVLSEAALAGVPLERVARAFADQPPWSDLPVVFLADGGDASPLARRALATLGNVTLVDRPVRVATLVSVLRTSIRARERQHQIRDQLEEVDELNARLERLAFYDSLTGLPNRSLLRDRLARAMARTRRHGGQCAVMFLDFDNFKVVNDSLGHDVGDRALQVVAERLSRVVRDEDTAARIGGDEFVVVLGDLAGPEDAAAVARKILAKVAEPFRLDEHEIRMTTSLGVALHDGGEETVDDLLKHADLAMYDAKAEGKRTFAFYTPTMHRRAMERLALEGELRLALERRELSLRYQPRVSLRDGAIVGFEALVRWDHAERGMLLPDEFVPIAEESGLVWELGRQVLDDACRQAKLWQSEDAPSVRVSVNLSVRQLQNAGLVELVEETLAAAELPPHLLELEITESATMARVDEMLPRLLALKRLGVCIAIDDFGTGYSSLEYLQRLPIDAIKIDRSFLSVEATSAVVEHDRAIVRAIVALGANLGIRLVAEGVETAEQHRFLAALGCDEGQGHLFGEPADPGQAAASLASAESVVTEPEPC